MIAKPHAAFFTRWKHLIRRNWLLIGCASLVLGVMGVGVSTYIQNRAITMNPITTDTPFGIHLCAETSPNLPYDVNPGGPMMPLVQGCAGTRLGWPKPFLTSSVQSVQLYGDTNKPGLSDPIIEPLGSSDLQFNSAVFLLDWLFWSVVGFVGISIVLGIVIQRPMRRGHSTHSTKLPPSPLSTKE